MKALLMVLALCSVPALARASAADGAHPAAHTRRLTLNGRRFMVELATTEAAREHGLMQRTSLAPDRGMLFVFRDLQPRWFWMKNTLVALDILYFGARRQLVSMQLDVPPCKADPCPTYPSGAAARYVLEVPAGTAARLGLQSGDQFVLDGRIGPVH